MTEQDNTTIRLIGPVLDCPDPRERADFYVALLGWAINEDASDPDFIEVDSPDGTVTLAFQLDVHHRPPTWPEATRPQRVHLDFRVADLDEGDRRAMAAGATRLPQPADRQDARFRVYADPGGHPFCLCS